MELLVSQERFGRTGFGAEVGGRIMGIRWRGHDLSFTQPGLEGQVVDVAAVENLSAKKREMGFPLGAATKRGSHRRLAGRRVRLLSGKRSNGKLIDLR